MKKIIFLSAMALFGLSNCQDDEIVQPVDPVQSGDEIQFGMTLTDTSTETKTIYGDPTIGDNGYPTSYPVYWEQNDEIMIFCAQADGDVKRVNYSITPNTANPAQAERVDKMSDEGLRWGSENAHRFYGIYPASAVEDIEESDQSGEIKFSIPTNQLVAKWKIERNDQGGITYNGIANTEYAYMYAYTEVHKDRLSNNELVNLRFKPLITVLEVTINGPIEVPNTENSVTVSNLNIEAIDENSAPILTGDFICHMRPTDNGTEIGDISVSDAGSSEESRGYIIIPLYIRQGTAETSGDVGNVSEYEKKAIALGPNDKIRVRGFFLRGDNNNEGGNIPVETLQLRVATIGGEANVKKLETGAILNHKVNIVNLPAVKKEGTNYWMTTLDQHIYATELSIPGSKFSSAIKGQASPYYQGYDIKQQFEDGIRAFIFQTKSTAKENTIGGWPFEQTFYTEPYGLNVIVEGGRFSSPLATQLEILANCLKVAKEQGGSGEFVFVQITAALGEGQEAGNVWIKAVSEVAKECAGKDLLIYDSEIDPNTTIGELAGHIVLKANTNPESGMEGVLKQDENTPVMFNAWTSFADNVPLRWGTWQHDNSSAKMKWFAQEVTNVSTSGTASGEESLETKQENAERVFQESVNLYKNGEHDTWFMNDLGGRYVGDANGEALARTMNAFGIQQLQERGENASLGLIYMNFADMQDDSGGTVRSDELIQTVIDNNFKFNLRKAGN